MSSRGEHPFLHPVFFPFLSVPTQKAELSRCPEPDAQVQAKRDQQMSVTMDRHMGPEAVTSTDGLVWPVICRFWSRRDEGFFFVVVVFIVAGFYCD